MAKIKVGLIGSGFVAELHMYAYKRVYGVDAEVVAVVSRGDHVEHFAKKHGIARTHRDYRALLADPAIDVVDICTPPASHAQLIVEAMRAGKHVICEKPFAGYFGRPGDPTPIGKHVPKSLMYEHVMAEMEEDARGNQVRRQALHVCRRLDLCARGGEDGRNPQSHQGQDPVHEGRGKP